MAYKNTRLTIGLITLLGATPSYPETYIVKRGDSLSKIASGRFTEERVYGINGSLRRVLKLNPTIKGPGRIYPQQVIKLEDDVSDQAKQATPGEQNSKAQCNRFCCGRPGRVRWLPTSFIAAT